LLPGAFPQVENPWPKSVGLDLPLTLAGGGAVFAGVLFAGSSAERRERAVTVGGVLGFIAGMGFYLLSLVAEVGFG
jgi:hypothetical protein